jgi:O-antigen/teichoic acid export membrane protein
LASRFFPLEMVGAWGVLQRIANMVSQAVLKITQTSVPALMEMHARGEEARFFKRSQQILWAQNVFAGLVLGFFAFGGEFLLKVWLGKELPLGGWILPLFTLSLLADFDQRFRFDLETVRLMMRRPTLVAFLKIILILISIPPLGHFYGLTGMVLALATVFGLILLPLSLLKIPCRSYSLPAVCTLAGAGAYLLAAGAGWLVMRWSL